MQLGSLTRVKAISAAPLIAVFLLLLAAFYFATTFQSCCVSEFAWDFSINWTASRGLQAGLSLYDHEGLQNLGLSLIGPLMEQTFRVQFDSYISPPSTALLLLPFSSWDFPTSQAVYRSALVVAFILAVIISGFALPAEARKVGWFCGLLIVFISQPVSLSIHLGQVDAWVVLALASSLWAVSKNRWGWAGVGLGIATLLKISPALLILYCLMRGQWRAALTAALTMMMVLTLAMIAGRPSDLWQFAFTVLPSLSSASLHIANQSLPAWLARILLPETDLVTFMINIGSFRVLSVVLVIAFFGILWSKRRGKALVALELALVIVAALLIGPLTWDHYISWATVFVVMLCNREWWSGWEPTQRRKLLALLISGALLLVLPTLLFVPEAIASLWVLRLATGMKTIGLIIFFGVGLGLLLHKPISYPENAVGRV